MSDVGELTEEERAVFSERPTLLAAAQRCNRYNAYDYTPVYISGVKVSRESPASRRSLVCVFLFVGHVVGLDVFVGCVWRAFVFFALSLTLLRPDRILRSVSNARRTTESMSRVGTAGVCVFAARLCIDVCVHTQRAPRCKTTSHRSYRRIISA